jgi:predicted Na+-dependent transporter
MNSIVHVLQLMGGRATTFLPLSLAVGLLFQNVAAAARPLLWPLAVALMMLALVRTDWSRVSTLLRRPVLAIVLALANLIAVPLIVWPIWHAVGLWPGLVAALCLSAMAPGIIAAAATAALLRLDSSLALLLTLFTNFLVPFTLPPLALWLLGLDLRISALDLSLRLALVVVLAGLGALAIRGLLRSRLSDHGTTLDGLSVIVLIVFAIPLMDGVVARAAAEPLRFASFAAAAFAGMLLCNLVMVVGTWPFRDRHTALTAGYCSGGRHNALLMAVLPTSVDADIFLFIAAVQFPIYLMPTLLQPIYRRLLR